MCYLVGVEAEVLVLYRVFLRVFLFFLCVFFFFSSRRRHTRLVSDWSSDVCSSDLSDVYLRCPDCNGKRFRDEVLEVVVGRKSIADVLELTVSEALAFFRDRPEVQRALKPLADVGLEYLRVGQPVPTLSGGEAQRLKLAGHLVEASSKPKGARGSLFLFDEPTTGLHFDDVAKLLSAFRQLIAAGHSLVVIEHNLDVIRASDWLIDLGPEGGDAGGAIVCTGTPAEIARHAS